MKIGFVSLPLSGHLNPMTALARKLQSRGNEILFIGDPDIESTVRAANLPFEPYSEEEHPAGSIARVWGPVAGLHGLDVIRYSALEIFTTSLEVALKRLPKKLIETRVEAVVLDAVPVHLPLVPMSLGIPFVQVWNILHFDSSGVTPPMFFSWPHKTTSDALSRNSEGLKTLATFFGPLTAVAQAYAKENGLEIDCSDYAAIASKLAIITQTPRQFDFEGAPWPAHFHYAGPLHDDEGREPIDFPWQKLTGEALIYSSLGSLVNGHPQIYRAILGAVEKLTGVQVVLSIGKNVNRDDLGSIPANTLVVRAAPQIELLKHAALCVTHAGLNTALEALAQGVPMVAIPIGFDQPGVAARIAHHRVGEFMEIDDLTVEGLTKLIRKVLNGSSYRDRSQYFRRVIAETRGLDLAADVIERAFRLPKYPRPFRPNPSKSKADRRVVAHV